MKTCSQNSKPRDCFEKHSVCKTCCKKATIGTCYKRAALGRQQYEILHLHKLRHIVDNVFQNLLQNQEVIKSNKSLYILCIPFLMECTEDETRN